MGTLAGRDVELQHRSALRAEDSTFAVSGGASGPLALALRAGKLTANFADSGQILRLVGQVQSATLMGCGEIPYRQRTGNCRHGTRNLEQRLPLKGVARPMAYGAFPSQSRTTGLVRPCGSGSTCRGPHQPPRAFRRMLELRPLSRILRGLPAVG
jgi:hypothetical protein